MSKLGDHVVSLELAKKLKEIGFKQDSIFYWVNSFHDEKPFLCPSVDSSFCSYLKPSENYPSGIICTNNDGDDDKCYEAFSAYTASELISFFKLSDGCYPDEEKLLIGLSNEDEWTIAFRNYRNPIDGFAGVDKNITEAIAKRIIYLNGHGVMEAPE